MNFSKPALKRALIYGVIGSLVASAFMGIFVIILGGFGDTEWKILATTVAVGVYSITSLASLRPLESASSATRLFSKFGILMSLVAFILIEAILWTPLWDVSGDEIYRIAVAATVLAVSTAHACLLLPLASRGRNVRTLTTATVLLIGAVAAMLIYLTFGDDLLLDGDGVFYRVLAVFAILDVLGTIITPIAAKFLTPAPVAAPVLPIISNPSED